MAPLLPSQEELDRRKVVGFGLEKITNASNSEYPDFFPGETGFAWSVESFKKNFRVQIHELNPDESTFSLIGLDASIANAFRRILIAEIPTLAIENVFINNNTSIIQDEVLASRLGLIPLKGNKEGLRWMKWFKEAKDGEPGSTLTDYNTVVLHLDVQCTWQEKGKELFMKGETDSNKLYHNSNVYPSQFTQQPIGRQADFFSGENAVQPVNPDILIAKLRPGQVITLTMHANKGKGGDHAKFSPVATATYRLMPKIDITQPIIGDDAKKFARCFPRGVIKLEPVTVGEAKRKGSGYEGQEGNLKAVVADPMKDTVSRECLRHKEFVDKVKLGRIRDHFIFKIESTGQFDSDELFLESVRLLKAKCMKMKRSLGEMTSHV
ncbi:RBP11-like subunits of RNA polymerase [Tothia fuscella]|uniref:DNA-directed RNA polymerases I and III subunit RPAC1 n=1 Tax=Tothia fuscella TaxID=1048955 RepID=A0A9P4P4F3_9PEZI|nr:RBP11-like subunits of RNA polymerase [Tothia fuscella]